MSYLNDLMRPPQNIQPITVSNVLEKLLEKEINIPKGIRSVASVSQNHLRNFLRSESDRDFTFPRVMSISDSDFLGGSFARHTKNWPLDDIDIYLPLDGFALFYIQNGFSLPYTVVSDGTLKINPILNRRWMNGNFISSAKLINEFAVVLRRHYPKETKIVPNGQAISVRMSQGATVLENGLGYDIVPCFMLKPFNPNDQSFYLMPDGNDGWLRTNPRIDTLISNKIQADNNKTFRKVVKLIKYWNSVLLGGCFNSYYIELTASRVFLERNGKREFIQSVPFGLALGFWALDQAVQNGDQNSWIVGSPPVEPGTINTEIRAFLSMTATHACHAWELEKAGASADAILIWEKILNYSFSTS